MADELLPELEQIQELDVPAGILFELRRLPRTDCPPVLLLHGASAQHETFCTPKGSSLAEYLWRQGYDTWLLDWRGSMRVTDRMDAESREGLRRVLDLDHAAIEDIPRALNRIAAVRDSENASFQYRIDIVAHCLGAAVVAQSIASGESEQVESKWFDRIGRVVLLTIGLFYEPPLDGKIKGQFNVLDRLWNDGEVQLIDPRYPEVPYLWPSGLREIYEGIGPGLRPHPQADAEPKCSHALCNRISFMYGTPFRHCNLVDEIHGVWRVKFIKGRVQPRVGERLRAVFVDATKSNTAAESVEGPADAPSAIAVEHPGVGVVSQVQRTSGSWRRGNAEGTLALSGCAGEFPRTVPEDDRGPVIYYELRSQDQSIGICDGRKFGSSELDELNPGLEAQFGGIPLRMYLQGALNVRRRWAAKFPSDRSAKLQDDKAYIHEDARGRFHKLPAVTLITGEHNQLWHRDSINRMHEWLMAGLNKDARERFTKVIIPNYGHQDLLWGKSAEQDVFRIILEKGLGTRMVADDDPSDPQEEPTPIA